MEDSGHAYKFYLNNYFFNGPFENMVMMGFSDWDGCKTWTSQRRKMKFCILIDLQRMNNFWNHFCQNEKHGNMAGGWILKLTFNNMG
jgi:hypothetical protein